VSTRSDVQQGRELEQREWGAFFEDINRRIEDGLDLEATIEIVSEQIVGPEAERLPLNGMTYEDGDDEIAIGVGGRGKRFPSVLWHFAERPRQVWVLDQDGQLTAIAIQSEDGTRTILYLYPSVGSSA
jgi:hypothetical protein